MIYTAAARGSDTVDGLVCFCASNVAQERILDADPAARCAFAGALAEQVVATLDRDLLPGVAQHLEFARVFTSTDLIRAAGAENGAIYGRRADVRAIASGMPRPQEPVDNLFHASAASHLPSIPAGVVRAMDLVEALTGVAVQG
jgi:phytoene dehydrogenase-like protein